MRFVAVLSVLLVGCEGSGARDAMDAQPVVESRVCMGASLDAIPQGDFNHWTSDLLSELSAHHMAEDILTTGAIDVPIRAKFSYGLTFKDLEDEEVEVFLGNCSGIATLLGTFTTDSDGVLEGSIDPSALPGYGRFPLFFRVVGDGSIVKSTLRNYPVGTHLAVFDIDGTLTAADGELFADMFSELFSGDYVPEAREMATEITHARADQGYEVVYLTGRPYWLEGITTEWIQTMDLAPATLHLTRSNLEVLPTNSSVGDYKADYLIGLQQDGFVIDYAYGNATTDVYGYAEAGINPIFTRIMGQHGGEGGTIAGGEGYAAHVTEVLAEQPVEQPYQ